jgi:hypothetical protein
MDKLLLKIIAVHPLGQRVHTGETNDLRGWHTIGNWRETGTEHSPGIQPADVQELLDRGAFPRNEKMP